MYRLLSVYWYELTFRRLLYAHISCLLALPLTHRSSPMAPSTPSPQQPALPFFSRAEVAKHAQTKDCWIVIDGEVYDVSKWLSRHPGGVRVLRHYAGEDATVGWYNRANNIIMRNIAAYIIYRGVGLRCFIFFTFRLPGRVSITTKVMLASSCRAFT